MPKIKSESPHPRAIPFSIGTRISTSFEANQLTPSRESIRNSPCNRIRPRGRNSESRAIRDRPAQRGRQVDAPSRLRRVVTVPGQERRQKSPSSGVACSDDSSDESSDSSQDSSRSSTPDIPTCDEELQALWQTLKTGFRGLQTGHLTASAMNITARRAVDKVRAQNRTLGKAGSQTTTANFRAGRYLRRTASLLKKMERTMEMLLGEEPKVLEALCVEKKRLNRLKKKAVLESAHT